MFPSILHADVVFVTNIQVAVWLFGAAIFYFFIQYSLGGTTETDINPIELFLALLSGVSYCSGLIKPDTNIGGKIAAVSEVSNEKTTSIVLDRIQT